jgi:FKBP-type peptidyl-prolyl cis-trans isomerase FkpA
MITTNSGLQYEGTKKMGGKLIKKGDLVRLNYKIALTLDDLILSKNLLDKSDSHEDPIIVPMGEGKLLKGVEEGLEGMEIGEARRLIVPPELAFGTRGVPGRVPPNSTLFIEINISTKTPTLSK